MSKGRYLKAAERACARKARFETAASARAFVEGRFGAYRCVVCGGYHLTSGRGERLPEPDAPRKEPPGPKLGDLDWSAVLNPTTSTPSPIENTPTLPSPTGEGPPTTARCVGPCGKDGRVLLVVEGRLAKSVPVARELRGSMDKDVVVRVEGDPPKVLGIA